MRISVVTVCFNSVTTIGRTVESVRCQTAPDVEHVVIDGGSTDGTLERLQEHSRSIAQVVSEPDEGLWDAMNKGIARATGDYIGFLNADDAFAAPETLARVAAKFAETDADVVYGFVDIVDPLESSRVVRRYRVRSYTRLSLRFGLMPAHPAFYCKASLFRELGGFSTDPRLAPDFEVMVRFLMRHDLRAALLPEVLVIMRGGGKSNSGISYRVTRFQRQVRSCRANGLWTAWPIVMMKYPYKLLEYVRRR